MVRSLLFLFILFLSFDSNAQGNAIYGKVAFPEVKRKIKVSRGTQYRNRLNQVKLEENRTPEIKPHEQVIISARPLDFNPTVTPTRASIAQKNKTFIPNVIAVTQGSVVEFVNNDDFYHNVFSLTPKARFNIGRRKPGKAVSQTIAKSGIIKIFCDIHPQMNAIIVSLETPYFSGLKEDGSYTLKNLPDGRYEVDFFHPTLSFPTTVVHVKGGVNKMHNFDQLVWVEDRDFQSLYVTTESCCTKNKGAGCEN